MLGDEKLGRSRRPIVDNRTSGYIIIGRIGSVAIIVIVVVFGVVAYCPCCVCLFFATSTRLIILNDFKILPSKSDMKSQRTTHDWCSALPSRPSISLLIPL